MNTIENIKCFDPIIDENCEILILGSIPSKFSREKNFYYSNPTNRFWKILSRIYKEDFELPDNQTKTNLLIKHHIALYDVYSSCVIKKDSSLDSNIRNQKFNDIPSIINNTQITKIYITSKKAYNEFLKHYKDWINTSNIQIISLPSPSSANRSKFKTDDELINEWHKILF